MEINMKTVVGFVVLVMLLLGVSIAGERSIVFGNNGGSGFYSWRTGLGGDMYTELGVGPITTGGSVTYTVNGLLGFKAMGHQLGLGLNYGSTGTTAYNLVVRHETPISSVLSLGVQGSIVNGSSSTSALTVFGSSAIYGVLHI